MAAPPVYVASPLGFSAPGRRWNDELLLPLLRDNGLQPIDPWAKADSPIPAALAVADPARRRAALVRANAEAGRMNLELLRAAAGVLAVLDGVDVDSGTAAEIGYAAALGLPITGLRTDERLAADNEGAIVNLQVEYLINASGGRIHRQPAAAAADLARLLSA